MIVNNHLIIDRAIGLSIRACCIAEFGTPFIAAVFVLCDRNWT